MIIGIGMVTWIVIVGLMGATRPTITTRRKRRTVLALRRYGLDLSVPPALPDQPQARRLTRKHGNHTEHPDYVGHIIPAKIYVAIWAILMVRRPSRSSRQRSNWRLQHRRSAGDCHHQRHPGRAVLHAPALQRQAHHGYRHGFHLLAIHPVLAHHDRLHLARLVHLQRALICCRWLKPTNTFPVVIPTEDFSPSGGTCFSACGTRVLGRNLRNPSARHSEQQRSCCHPDRGLSARVEGSAFLATELACWTEPAQPERLGRGR